MNTQSLDLELKAKIFRGFADPTRLSILETMKNGERSVGTIAKMTEQSQSNVSNHLSCLRECGLVTSRRNGRRIMYSIASETVLNLLRQGDLVLDEVREGVRSCSRYKY